MRSAIYHSLRAWKRKAGIEKSECLESSILN